MSHRKFPQDVYSHGPSTDGCSTGKRQPTSEGTTTTGDSRDQVSTLTESVTHTAMTVTGMQYLLTRIDIHLHEFECPFFVRNLES